jgi:hypothetical protein
MKNVKIRVISKISEKRILVIGDWRMKKLEWGMCKINPVL